MWTALIGLTFLFLGCCHADAGCRNGGLRVGRRCYKVITEPRDCNSIECRLPDTESKAVIDKLKELPGLSNGPVWIGPGNKVLEVTESRVAMHNEMTCETALPYVCFEESGEGDSVRDPMMCPG